MATTVIWKQHVTWDGVNYRPGDVGTVDDHDADRLVHSNYAQVGTAPLPDVTFPNPLPQYVTDEELQAEVADKVQPAVVSAVTQPGPARDALDAEYVTVNEGPLNASRYANLQAAANAMPAAGGDMRIPPGTYTGNVSFKPGTRAVGAGRNATLIKGTVSVINGTGNSLADVGIRPQGDSNGLVVDGCYRGEFRRLTIENDKAGYGGTSLHIVGRAANPTFFTDFSDISMIHHSGGGRLALLDAPDPDDWITACTFTNLSGRGSGAAKVGQGIRTQGDGVVQHTRWDTCYVEYVQYEGWRFHSGATFNSLVNVTTEVAGLAYLIEGNYLTAIDVKSFMCAAEWEFGSTAGHTILTPTVTRLNNAEFDLGTDGRITSSGTWGSLVTPIDLGGDEGTDVDGTPLYGIGRGDRNLVAEQRYYSKEHHTFMANGRRGFRISSRSINPPAVTTAERPSAGSVGNGAICYDQTLNKLITVTAGAWTDLQGNPV